jgi:Fur family ferric uptake transcriptional regulator
MRFNMESLMIKDNKSKLNEYNDQFRECGLRVTHPRRVILETMLDAKKLLSAEDIYMQIKEKTPGIGLATIYRNLVVMNEMGVITKYDFGDDKARYEITDTRTNKQVIVICENCRRIEKHIAITGDETALINRLTESAISSFGFCITRQIVELHGICPDCKKQLEDYDRLDEEE